MGVQGQMDGQRYAQRECPHQGSRERTGEDRLLRVQLRSSSREALQSTSERFIRHRLLGDQEQRRETDLLGRCEPDAEGQSACSETQSTGLSRGYHYARLHGFNHDAGDGYEPVRRIHLRSERRGGNCKTDSELLHRVYREPECRYSAVRYIRSNPGATAHRYRCRLRYQPFV